MSCLMNLLFRLLESKYVRKLKIKCWNSNESTTGMVHACSLGTGMPYTPLLWAKLG